MSPESRQAELLASWLAQRAQGDVHPEPPDGLDPDVVDAVSALRPDRAPAPRVTLDDILFEVADGPMAEAVDPRHVQALAGWLDEDDAAALPDDLDSDILDVVSVLRPDRAPAPRVSIDDILAEVSAGPLHGAQPVGAGPVDNVVALHPAAPPPEEVAEAEAPPRRRLPVWLYPSVAGLAMAAIALLFVAPSAEEAMQAPAAASTAEASWAGVEEEAEAGGLAQERKPAERAGGATRPASGARREVAPAKDAAPAPPPPAPTATPVAASEPMAVGGLVSEQRDAEDQLAALGYVETAADGARPADPAPEPEPAAKAAASKPPPGRTAPGASREGSLGRADRVEDRNTGGGWVLADGEREGEGALNTGIGDTAGRGRGSAANTGDWGGADANTGSWNTGPVAAAPAGGAAAAGQPAFDETVVVAGLEAEEDVRGSYRYDNDLEATASAEEAVGRTRGGEEAHRDPVGQDRRQASRTREPKARKRAEERADLPAAPAEAPRPATQAAAGDDDAPEENERRLDDLRTAAAVPAQASDARLMFPDAYVALDRATDGAQQARALEDMLAHPSPIVAQDAAYRLARLHLGQGRRDLALAAIARGLGRAGGRGADRARLLGLRGEIMEQMGDEKGATMSYEQAIDAQ